MVRENHPNKCPHICLYLIVKQQTCRSGRFPAEGVTPAEVAHYTYRLTPCKPFLKKVFGAMQTTETQWRFARGMQSLTTAVAARKTLNPSTTRHHCALHGNRHAEATVSAPAAGIGEGAIRARPQRSTRKPPPRRRRIARAIRGAAKRGVSLDKSTDAAAASAYPAAASRCQSKSGPAATGRPRQKNLPAHKGAP